MVGYLAGDHLAAASIEEALVALVNAAATLFLTGLIWMVQVVVYPSFRHIDPAVFPQAMTDHQRHITRVLALPWMAQGIASFWLVIAPPQGVSPLLAWLGLGLSGITVVATVALAVPAHRHLSVKPDEDVLQRLIAGNWVRTGAWSLGAVVAVIMLTSTVG